MSFDGHERCRRCGADDTASHTTDECERIRRERAESRRLYDATHGAARCGRDNPCEWMRAALAASIASERTAVFTRREMDHPDTLRPVVRYVVLTTGQPSRLIRACPACGGNPNEQETVTR